MRSELIDSTIVGVSSPERITQTIELAGVEIPDELWSGSSRLSLLGNSGWTEMIILRGL
jgi:D-threo-aldose 1-dehydrogenase